MKLLLVGATGQIGTALTMRLAQAEHALRILVRRAPSPLPLGNVEILEHGEFTPAAFVEALADVDLAIYDRDHSPVKYVVIGSKHPVSSSPTAASACPAPSSISRSMDISESSRGAIFE